MKSFGLIDETKLFHFHRIFKNGGGGGGGGIRADPPPIIPHLDPSMFYNRFHFQPLLIIWTVGKKTYLHMFGNKKNVADQPAYSCSLISGFVI